MSHFKIRVDFPEGFVLVKPLGYSEVSKKQKEEKEYKKILNEASEEEREKLQMENTGKEINLVKERFISGNWKEGGEIKIEDLDEFPIALITEILLKIYQGGDIKKN